MAFLVLKEESVDIPPKRDKEEASDYIPWTIIGNHNHKGGFVMSLGDFAGGTKQEWNITQKKDDTILEW